jgi:uncharacterized protein YjbI with pentapeptide repeats
MANEEHLAILKHGVEVWNAWRKANPEIEPDLSGVNLSSGNLSKAYLGRTDLSGADLRGADLSDADMMAANLT